MQIINIALCVSNDCTVFNNVPSELCASRPGPKEDSNLIPGLGWLCIWYYVNLLAMYRRPPYFVSFFPE